MFQSRACVSFARSCCVTRALRHGCDKKKGGEKRERRSRRIRTREEDENIRLFSRQTKECSVTPM